jgi:apolipoprotein N-acyltransferase
MAGVADLAGRIMTAHGWPRRLTALAAGAASALAMPPFGIWPVLFVTLPAAVWLIDGSAMAGRRPRLASALAAAAAGWWFGFGFFLAGLWWLGSAFLVEADLFAWALPLGVLGLPMGLAFFHAAGFALARAMWSHDGRRILAFGAALAIVEWLRGHILTGFPWNSLGMALGGGDVLAQGAAWVGLYGLTLIAATLFAAPATLGTGETPAARRRAPVLALIGLALLAGFGQWRLAGASDAKVADVRLRIMQPNLPQDEKFRPENREAIMRRYLTLSDRATSPSRTGLGDVTHLIWPESAFPFILARDGQALAQIAALLPQGVTLVTGAARAEAPLPGEEGVRYFNAIQVVSDDGVVLDSYDKAHLVPFGEYLPLRGLFDATGLRQFVAIPGGFEAGNGRKRLSVRGLPPVSPLICYEAIFPGAVGVPGGRPGVLLNVTNDAWFGATPGPHQHLAQARLRAIEEGVPLVRAANTGISAVVDPHGRIRASLPIGAEGVLDADLPRAIAPTPYSRFGDLPFALALAAWLAAALRLHPLRRSTKPI